MKTVKVRIAVAIDPKGDWHCCGWNNLADDEAFSYAVETLEAGEARYILTAELALPEVRVIAPCVEVVEPKGE